MLSLSCCNCLDTRLFIHHSLWILTTESVFFFFRIFSALLSLAPQSWRKRKGAIRPLKCALCVLHQSVGNVHGCEVCVYAWTGFIWNGPSQTYSQLGKLVEQGTNLATSLFCLARSARWIKTLSFCIYVIYSARNYSTPGALVFTMCEVKGWKKEWHTNTAPTLSVASYQPHFVDESTAEYDPAALPPPQRPVAGPAKGTVHHNHCDLFLRIWGLCFIFLGLFRHQMCCVSKALGLKTDSL